MATLPTNKISDGRRGCNVYGITTWALDALKKRSLDYISVCAGVNVMELWMWPLRASTSVGLKPRFKLF
jgi:hypothetical protein